MDDSTPYPAVAFSRQPSVAYFLKGVLDCAGFTVVAALSSPHELEAIVAQTKPKVIVYDVSYPFKESWDALQELRQMPAFSATPVVVTTSEAHALYRALGVSAAIEIFARPNDVTELREVVRRTVEAGACSA
jgi:DNA-binding NarL/FixJ family response regulator